jgi:membrane fusion protein (multidrug efflux system)
VSGEQVARADMKGAQARLREARLNLGYAKVESPITGVASRALKSEGALISGPDVLLTTVSQVNPIFVNFGIPDNDQLKLRRDIENGSLTLPEGGKFEVQVRTADGSIYGRTGKLDFSDVRISPATGTSDARAELPNPDTRLRPGQFVKVRLLGALRKGAVKVPQRAVLEGPAGKFVYLAVPGDKGGPEGQMRAEMRAVEVGEWTGDAWVIRSGLKAGERVITDGVMKIGPGAPVAIGPAGGQSPGAAPPAAKDVSRDAAKAVPAKSTEPKPADKK